MSRSISFAILYKSLVLILPFHISAAFYICITVTFVADQSTAFVAVAMAAGATPTETAIICLAQILCVNHTTALMTANPCFTFFYCVAHKGEEVDSDPCTLIRYLGSVLLADGEVRLTVRSAYLWCYLLEHGNDCITLYTMKIIEKYHTL